MKNLVLTVVFCFCLFAPQTTWAWGRLGHAVVANIAEANLTPKARERVMYYMHGQPLRDVSSFVDEVAGIEPYKTAFLGWHASMANPECKSPLYVRYQGRNLRDGVTAMYFLRELLKDYKALDDSTVLCGIKCMVHLVGDFHCPEHVRFTDDLNDGKFAITFFGKPTTYHKIWDTALIVKGHPGWTVEQWTKHLNTWKKKQIKAVTKGWAQEWFEDGAKDVRPLVGKVREGAQIEMNFVQEHLPLAELELTKAGYQLAAALNEIFGK